MLRRLWEGLSLLDGGPLAIVKVLLVRLIQLSIAGREITLIIFGLNDISSCDFGTYIDTNIIGIFASILTFTMQVSGIFTMADNSMRPCTGNGTLLGITAASNSLQLNHGIHIEQHIHEGGVFYGHIFEFCFDDADCRARLEQFETEYEHYGREVRRSEQRRKPEARQKWLAEQWLRAYNDWVSVYENHKVCPQTRNRHEHFRALRVANVCIGGFGLPDRLRLGRNPNSLPIPTVEIQRTRTPTPMRR
ncbi:hypothetical protein Q7P35_001132 [Cladosporium inversicolor]